MTRTPLRRAAGVALAATLALAGCSSSDYDGGSVHGSVSMYYGAGYYDPWYYGPGYPPPVIVAPPPGSRPPNARPPAARPQPLPSRPAPRPTPSRRR